MAARILGTKGLSQGETLFRRTGGWIVVLSRWLPVFPEVVACMAGLTRMPMAAFMLALACGSVPLSFAFAAVGSAGVAHPGLALAVSAGAPPLLWLLVRPAFDRRLRDSQAPQSGILDA
jgi:membrane protein DedA with SNARE-associated domain